MRLTGILALIAVLFPPSLLAAPIFTTGEWYIGDGGSYDANTYPNSVFNVSSGTLSILPGAVNLSVQSSGNGATILMSGGQVQDGITVNQGSLNISGGQVNGYDNPAYGGNAVFVSAQCKSQGGFSPEETRPAWREAV